MLTVYKKQDISVMNEPRYKQPCVYALGCHRKSLMDGTSHLFSALRSYFQLRKPSELMTRSRAVLSKSAFRKQFGWYEHFSGEHDSDYMFWDAVVFCVEECWWHWSFCWYFRRMPVSCLSLLFLLISGELSWWKVLPSLIRCYHCVKKSKLV